MSCDVEKTKFYFAPQCTTIDFWEGLSRRENVTDVNGTVTEELRLWGLRFLLVVAMLMALMIILMLINGDNKDKDKVKRANIKHLFGPILGLLLM